MFNIPGVPTDVVEFYPLIVTLEPIVMTGPLYEELARIVAKERIAFSARTRPWQMIQIGELEVACLGIAEGRSFGELLAEKAADESHLGEAFLNFRHLRGESFLSADHHPFLQRVFDRSSELALKWIRSRQKEHKEQGGSE